MKHMEFFSSIKENLAPVYVFHGVEEYIKERAMGALIGAAVVEKELDCSVLDAGVSVDELFAACETLPFMSPKRMIIAKDVKALSKPDESERLIEYIERMPEYTCLLIYFHGKLDKRKKETKALIKAAVEVEFSTPDDDEIAIWVQKTSKRYGREISRNNAYNLIFNSGRNFLDLDNELQKLSSLSDTEITKNDIESVATKTLDYNVFKMTDHLLAGRIAEGFDMLRDMIKNGEKAYMIIPAVASKLRIMLTAKTMLENRMSEAAVKSALGSGYDVVYAIRDSRKKSLAWLKKAVLTIGQADYDIKSGAMPDLLSLEYHLMEIFG